jgi:hypothetical protein
MDGDKRRYLRNVIVISAMDGKVTPEEQAFIGRLREELEISRDEFDEVVAEVRKNPQRLSVPRGPEAREVFDTLVEAARADGEITEREKRLLRKVARHIGFSEQELAEILPGAGPDPAVLEAIDRQIDELYAGFGQWDAGTRGAKLDAVAGHGETAVLPLLGVLESYRTPDDCEDALELKTLVVDRLGRIEDERAVYYLAQQVSLSNEDDEITNADLRGACAEAMGRIVGKEFTRDPDGVEASRLWWRANQQSRFNRLAM